MTKKTKACFEPTLDYVVVKMPKFPFDKFVYAKRDLGTQMKATGEVMAIGQSFEEALLKAARGAELKTMSLDLPAFSRESDGKIVTRVGQCTDQRIFAIYQALKRGLMTVEEIHGITKIDKWFLWKIQGIAAAQKARGDAEQSALLYPPSSFKMVDTCAGEFAAETPYFYSTGALPNGSPSQNEAADYLEETRAACPSNKTIVVLGSGPIRIGQGIEFDYASVQCVRALKKMGYQVAIINNNPETVSTDFDTADRLYFEPLTGQDVMNVINTEKPLGVVAAFGGQTAINLTKYLDKQGVPILGTSADSIDLAEDRERFEELCDKLGIKRPKGVTVFTEAEALEAAAKIGYPVLLRPSYVLGGQNMIIANTSADVKEYMAIILRQKIENPVLIDKYMEGVELEIDGICDGQDVLLPGIMQHVERTGIHSGDSIAVYPSWSISDALKEKIIRQSTDLALALGTKGLVNIQYLIWNDDLYIIEANPRSSRTVPYLSKVTGIPMVELATRAMMGEKIRDMGFGTGLYRAPNYFAVKVPVFSFEKLMDVDTALGPEMKSTGEVLGIAPTRKEALFKGMVAAGIKMIKPTGDAPNGILFSVKKMDLPELPALAERFHKLGFVLYGTSGNADTMVRSGLPAISVAKVHEDPNQNIITLLDSGRVAYVVSTSAKGRNPDAESVKFRRHAVERDIECLTAIDTANALADCLESGLTQDDISLVDITKI